MSEAAVGTLHIGDGRDWHFVNGAWHDGDNMLTLSDETRAGDEGGLQGHHYAFYRHNSYEDVRIEFDFRLAPHSDAGVILRARDESHYYLLHFPNCGQASRAQHFWAALSKMDESGYLRIIKLAMIPRVPSNSNIWLHADVSLIGHHLTVRIGEHGLFEAEDSTYRGPGRIGAYLCGNANLRHLSVRGEPRGHQSWDDRASPQVNWFHPYPDTKHGQWQQPLDLLRFSDGEILLGYNVREKIYEGKSTPLTVRSHDGGRTWGQPEMLQVLQGDYEWQPARLHLTPQDRLVCFVDTKGGFHTAESLDRARTWSEPVLTNIPARTEHIERLVMGPAGPLNLADGSMLLFLYGGHDLKMPEMIGFPWGGLHCQAFASRSTDDGRTWSPPVNVDNPGLGPDGKLWDSNLDLTEVCGAQMSDGRIMALIRPCFSAWMWETWSHDGGATWGPCVRGPFPGYATPNMLRTASGALLVAHRLPCLTIHTSLDEGHTWDQGTLIDGGLWAMGSMLEVEPDLVLYIYWDSFGELMRGQFLRVTPSGLMPERF